MFGISGHNVIDATFATGGTFTSVIPVRGYNHVAIEVATMGAGFTGDAATCIYVLGSNSSTGTFRRIVEEGAYSAGVGIADWETPAGTGNRVFICRPAARFNFIKCELSSAATSGLSCRVHVHN